MDEKGRKVINVPFQELVRNTKWNEIDQKPYLPPAANQLLEEQSSERKDEDIKDSSLEPDPEKMFLCVKYGDDEEEAEETSGDGYADDSAPAPKLKKPKLQYGGIRVIEKEEKTQKNEIFDDEFDQVW